MCPLKNRSLPLIYSVAMSLYDIKSELLAHCVVVHSIFSHLSPVSMCSLPIDSRMAHLHGAVCFR